jgi:hypothetical protein
MLAGTAVGAQDGIEPPTGERSWKKFESGNVLWSNHREMASIQRCHGTDTESLGERNHGRVDRPEGKVVVTAHQFGDPYPIASLHWLGDQISGGEVTEEPNLRTPAQACFDQIGDFGNDELRHQQGTRMGFQEPQARFVIAVVFVDVGVQRSGIDDQRDRPVSSRMISLMRRAVSWVPLRPALAASSFLRARPPRWISIASRVMSATVL